MKGVINKGVQEMVETMYGEQAWERVKTLAGCDEPFYAVSLDYPDDSTSALIKAACEVSGLSADALMVEYGKFVVLNTLRKYYPTYVSLAGASPRDFLLNMGRIHEQVTRGISNAMPPRFEYDELPDGRLLMHYDSKRGLCAVLRGLILGVGLLFDQSLGVQEIACMRSGAPRCTMEVTFP
jgi:predicted hydrocarbon binding protein